MLTVRLLIEDFAGWEDWPVFSLIPEVKRGDLGRIIEQNHQTMNSGHIANQAANGASPAKMWLRALEMTAPIANNRARVLPIVIEDLATELGDVPAVVSGGEQVTYRQLAQRSNRYARWALRQCLGKGEVVCLLMPNRAEYLAIWLGVTRIGGVVSLLNTNLAGASLAHCINIVNPKHLIVAGELSESFASAHPHIAADLKVWLQGSDEHNFSRIEDEIEKVSGERLADVELPSVSIDDRALCIYTSGTTGLPKAANVNHYRLMYWSHWFAGLMNVQSADRLYNCLPNVSQRWWRCCHWGNWHRKRNPVCPGEC